MRLAGRYSLEHEIGRGGMGAVWLGRDEVLGRPVALKRIGLLPGEDQADLARAEREAHLSARLHHPHVVVVFDFVEDDDTGDQWLVMEYVEGVTLADLIRDGGALAPDQAAPLLQQAADGLAAAHAAGITHRDVKPSNILVDNTGVVKLSDFGIARTLADPSLTQTGLVIGSPTYLAPEVASGSRGDMAADIWSFGATAFYVLSGRMPYRVDDNVLGTVHRIVNDEPPVLDDAGWMAPLLEATMVKDPALRWSAEEIRDFLAGAPPPAIGQATTNVPIISAPARSDEATQALRAGSSSRPSSRSARRPSTRLLLLAGSLVLVAAVALSVVLFNSGSRSGSNATPTTGSGSDAGSSSSADPQPTTEGMTAFIRKYVKEVSEDPDQAWTMLTPKFQRASGGLDRYRDFWGPATNGRVLSISADPHALTVSYQVHFDDFDNGPGPTRLDLSFNKGRYLINAENTKGFKPAD